MHGRVGALPGDDLKTGPIVIYLPHILFRLVFCDESEANIFFLVNFYELNTPGASWILIAFGFCEVTHPRNLCNVGAKIKNVRTQRFRSDKDKFLLYFIGHSNADTADTLYYMKLARCELQRLLLIYCSPKYRVIE